MEVIWRQLREVIEPVSRVEGKVAGLQPGQRKWESCTDSEESCTGTPKDTEERQSKLSQRTEKETGITSQEEESGGCQSNAGRMKEDSSCGLEEEAEGGQKGQSKDLQGICTNNSNINHRANPESETPNQFTPILNPSGKVKLITPRLTDTTMVTAKSGEERQTDGGKPMAGSMNID
ncbi:hypothetical protein BY996DRAFT_6481368 [Phakopsora pachyrhizi]|nr:hypothetical protein BY996DRAFT_6481368 [Phakopsora pachyrhizi]